jgi:hypothetical protein
MYNYQLKISSYAKVPRTAPAAGDNSLVERGALTPSAKNKV